MVAFGDRRGELRCWSIVGRVLAAPWIALGIAISPEAVAAGFGAAYSLFHDLAASAIRKS